MSSEFTETGYKLPRLKDEVRQSLWSGSEDFVITRKAIERALLNFLGKKLTATDHTHVRRSTLDLTVQNILGKIGVQDLNDIHRAIKKEKNKEEKDRISNQQIDLLVNAINLVIGEYQGSEFEDRIPAVQELLD